MVGLAVVAAFAMTGRLPGPGPCDAQEGQPCSRVLFIGNSYTYVNDLPGMFTELAKAGGHRVETGLAAEGGATLADQVNSPGTLDKLGSSRWDFVVLQEQSQIPSVEQVRRQQMYPAARSLARRIEDAGARPILFMTWAHRDGWPENGLPDYESMQVAIDDGYLGIARELGVPVAPVGYAWLLTHRQDPRLELWQPDGSHPSAQGSYLAACVFYAAMFHESPEGLSYLADLPDQTARLLQTVAADAVLSNPAQWNLP